MIKRMKKVICTSNKIQQPLCTSSLLCEPPYPFQQHCTPIPYLPTAPRSKNLTNPQKYTPSLGQIDSQHGYSAGKIGAFPRAVIADARGPYYERRACEARCPFVSGIYMYACGGTRSRRRSWIFLRIVMNRLVDSTRDFLGIGRVA